MSRTLRIVFTLAFCLLLVSGVGCTRNRTRTRLSGTVLTNGQPVKAGRVTFTPLNGGRAYSDTLTGGRFSVRSRSNLPGGDYSVTIQYASTAGGRGHDRTHTERVTLTGFGKDVFTFHVK
jgi:hypothetical protein